MDTARASIQRNLLSNAISQAVCKSLNAKGLTVEYISFPQCVPHDYQGYKRKLLKAIDQLQPNLLIPMGNSYNMAKFREEILPASLPTVLIDESAKIALLDNKVRCSRLATSLGIPQPHFYETPEEVDAFPVIFKKERSFGGSGVYKPESLDALRNLAKKEQEVPGRQFLIESFIEGNDYSIDVVRVGSFWQSGVYKSLSKSQRQGPATKRRAVDFPLLDQYARILLDYVDYQGVCGLDFRVDAEGNAYFLECNPRFTGGIATQIKAGFDIPFTLVYQWLRHRI